jgi:shikimate kinase
MTAVDCDLELEARLGTSLASWIEGKGEADFRRQEAHCLAALLQRPGVVLATGGGCVLLQENRELLGQRLCLWLDAPWELLAERIRGSARPSLSGAPIEVELQNQLRERRAFYAALSKGRIDAAASVERVLAQALALCTRSY